MTHGHAFWFYLVWACVVWYSTITIYVSVKGSFDILQMLKDLATRSDTASGNNPASSPPGSHRASE